LNLVYGGANPPPAAILFRQSVESDASRGIGNSLAHVRMADLSLQYSNAEKTGLNPAKCRCESDLEHHFRPRIPMQRK
jgi:hypothetical protein